jgi:hypothetical protein
MCLRVKFGIDYVIPITSRRLVNCHSGRGRGRGQYPDTWDSRWSVTLPIANCGFPIGFFRFGLIGNRQSQIGNVDGRSRS